MNFENLLDENGEGSRELDAWLFDKINLNDRYPDNHPTDIYYEKDDGYPQYTTGDSIDLILNLARDYFVDERTILELVFGETSEKINLCRTADGDVVSNFWNDPKISIAEALFKAYQEKKEV